MPYYRICHRLRSISRDNYTTACDPDAFAAALDRITKAVAPTIAWLYQPIGTRCWMWPATAVTDAGGSVSPGPPAAIAGLCIELAAATFRSCRLFSHARQPIPLARFGPGRAPTCAGLPNRSINCCKNGSP